MGSRAILEKNRNPEVRRWSHYLCLTPRCQFAMPWGHDPPCRTRPSVRTDPDCRLQRGYSCVTARGSLALRRGGRKWTSFNVARPPVEGAASITAA